MAWTCQTKVFTQQKMIQRALVVTSTNIKTKIFPLPGVHLGVILAFPISGFLLCLPLGWELIYYALAMIILSMAVVIGTLTASSPEEHRAISDKELEYILDSLNLYRKVCMFFEIS